MAPRVSIRAAGACTVTTWLIVSSIVLPLLLSEFSEISPWAARRLLTWGSRRLPGNGLSERYREEWLAGIEEVPGKLTKLAKAVSIVCYMVPAMNWCINGSSYLWPVRRIADALISRVAPSFAARRRERLTLSYEIYMGVPARGKSDPFTIGQFRDFIVSPPRPASSARILPEKEMFRDGALAGMLDHKRKQFTVFVGNDTEYRRFSLEGLSYEEADGPRRGRVRLDLKSLS